MAVAVYMLSDYNLDVAADFMMSKSSNESSHHTENGDVVRDMYLRMPLDSLFRLEQPATAADERIRVAALKFIAKRQTCEFVKHANTHQGAAPSSRETASKYIQICDALGLNSSNPGLRKSLESNAGSHTSQRCVRKWSQKFRQHWGLGFGALRARDPLPEAEVIEKAWFWYLKAQLHNVFAAKCVCPFFGARFWAHFSNPYLAICFCRDKELAQNRARNLAPVLGPRKNEKITPAGHIVLTLGRLVEAAGRASYTTFAAEPR